MAFVCDPPCSKTFKTAAARDQHKGNAPKHTGYLDRVQSLALDKIAPAPPPTSLDNASLSRSFNTALVLFSEPKGKGKQKEEPFPCASCNIAFVSQEVLDDHFKRSPRHQWVQPACVPCNKTFGTQALLEDHLASSLAHRTLSFMPSGRVFDSGSALNAHLNDSPANKKTFSCTSCNRTFASQLALDDHMKDSPAHKKKIMCLPCNKEFASQSALDDHMRFSPVHKKKFMCLPCNKEFASESALDDHMRDSPAHKKKFMCLPCNKDFASESALQAHVGDSPKHRTSQNTAFPCPSCNRSFGSRDALGMHLKSPKHALASAIAKRDSSDSWDSLDILGIIETPGTSVTAELSPPDTPDAPCAPDTPLDLFFRSFPGFHYNRKESPEESFRKLKMFSQWKTDSKPANKAWQTYQDALVEEVELWFGDTSDIHAWHHLCEAVGISDPPPAIQECKKIVKKTHVNIVDLIDWGRAGSPASRPVKIFKNVFGLSAYTRESAKIFPRGQVVSREGHKNIVLKHLLRTIFT
ncbi:zinc finger protein 135-like protein [Ophiostoma piceae UAMH 11346]|uniref:Zinc finger protein 135-like protein n=1 Tax=Ophiostoma piceae (strain UAMH 11346) TaxID=1262450 RepID=S3C3Y3_OPHP1|nr:zinc finger protein 135-like protein [Ophiostoma piceae UAMH 11346]